MTQAALVCPSVTSWAPSSSRFSESTDIIRDNRCQTSSCNIHPYSGALSRQAAEDSWKEFAGAHCSQFRRVSLLVVWVYAGLGTHDAAVTTHHARSRNKPKTRRVFESVMSAQGKVDTRCPMLPCGLEKSTMLAGHRRVACPSGPAVPTLSLQDSTNRKQVSVPARWTRPGAACSADGARRTRARPRPWLVHNTVLRKPTKPASSA